MENILIEPEIGRRLMWLLSIITADYLLVLAAVAGDLFSGLRKARLRGERTRSRSLRRTVDKLARYYNVLLVLTIVDGMLICFSLYLRSVEGYDVPTLPFFTLVGALGMAIIEVKSIFEKGSEKERQQIGELANLLESLPGVEKLREIVEILTKLKGK